jgi:ribosomal protein L37E
MFKPCGGEGDDMATAERPTANDEPTNNCRRCGSYVPTDAHAGNVLADRCPSCGFDPESEHGRKMRLWGLITAFFAFTVIGLPLALLTAVPAWRHRREVRRGLVA